MGLSIPPGIDTLLSPLPASITRARLGPARRDLDLSWALGSLGGETWFNLGDGDLATHVERTWRLAAGESLSRITEDFRRRLGISVRLLPMSDDRVRTRLLTAVGWLDFQDYFVRQRCAPAVREIAFAGAAEARPQPEFLAALSDRDLRAVVICPSNPFISIDPILAVPGVRAALRACPAPVVAVSPIIGGKAVKGPTAKMMAELGLPVDAAAVARHYGDILDLYVADRRMRTRSPKRLPGGVYATLMRSPRIASAGAGGAEAAAEALRWASGPSCRQGAGLTKSALPHLLPDPGGAGTGEMLEECWRR